jgi:hypothetical protein
LESTGQDVIVDTGRLGLVGSPEPLLANADLTLIVTRSTLPALSAVRPWAYSLQRGTFDWQQSGVLIVGEGQPYRSREVTQVLNLPVVATLADDGESAAVFSRGSTPPKKFASIHATVSQRRSELLEGVRP